jgi:hypothetical protein
MPMNPMRTLAMACASVMCLAVSSVRADWTLTTADMKDQPRLTINSLIGDDGLSTTVLGGKLLNLPLREVLSLSSGLKVVPYPGSNAWKLAIRTGDVYYGDAVKVKGNSLMFKVEGIEGEIAIPIKRILTLSAPVYGAAAVASRQKKYPVATDKDIIVFKQADNLSGIFADINDSIVKFQTADGALSDISLTNVDTIVFGGTKPPRTVPPLSVRVTLRQGSVITIPVTAGGKEFQWEVLGKISFKDAAGTAHALKDEEVVSVEVAGGRVVYLTELDIDKEEQTSFLGSGWPAQINKNVLGQPMRIARTTYDRGIGVHTQSNLTYELDGTFEALSLRVGLDDSAAPNGEAQVSIVLDGKTLWEAKTLKPGEISQELSLPIAGGKKLELRADSAAKLDVQGRVNWVNVALRRK